MVKELDIQEWKVEHITYVGLFIAIGRIIGYILMLIAGIFNNIVVFKSVLVIVTLFAPIYAKLMNEVEIGRHKNEKL